jgi:hypothetical protein
VAVEPSLHVTVAAPEGLTRIKLAAINTDPANMVRMFVSLLMPVYQ